MLYLSFSLYVYFWRSRIHIIAFFDFILCSSGSSRSICIFIESQVGVFSISNKLELHYCKSASYHHPGIQKLCRGNWTFFSLQQKRFTSRPNSFFSRVSYLCHTNDTRRKVWIKAKNKALDHVWWAASHKDLWSSCLHPAFHSFHTAWHLDYNNRWFVHKLYLRRRFAVA